MKVQTRLVTGMVQEGSQSLTNFGDPRNMPNLPVFDLAQWSLKADCSHKPRSLLKGPQTLKGTAVECTSSHVTQHNDHEGPKQNTEGSAQRRVDSSNRVDMWGSQELQS